MVIASEGALLPIGLLARAVARGGADILQVRHQGSADRVLVATTASAVAAVAGTACRVVVNDRLDVALAARAHGVHLKSRGLDVREVRDAAARAGGDAFLVGVSCHDAADLAAAAASAPDWLTIGPLGAVPGKQALGHAGLAAALEGGRARGALPPWLALGGVRAPDVPALAALAGPGETWGLAVLRAVARAPDEDGVARAVAELARALDEGAAALQPPQPPL
jgi:thiamine-phosphate pyrophosphorylase